MSLFISFLKKVYSKVILCESGWSIRQTIPNVKQETAGLLWECLLDLLGPNSSVSHKCWYQVFVAGMAKGGKLIIITDVNTVSFKLIITLRDN